MEKENNIKINKDLDVLSMCVGCKKIKPEDNWFFINEDFQSYVNYVEHYKKEYKISHGYCPPCADKAIDEMHKDFDMNKKSNQS